MNSFRIPLQRRQGFGVNFLKSKSPTKLVILGEGSRQTLDDSQ